MFPNKNEGDISLKDLIDTLQQPFAFSDSYWGISLLFVYGHWENRKASDEVAHSTSPFICSLHGTEIRLWCWDFSVFENLDLQCYREFHWRILTKMVGIFLAKMNLKITYQSCRLYFQVKMLNLSKNWPDTIRLWDDQQEYRWLSSLFNIGTVKLQSKLYSIMCFEVCFKKYISNRTIKKCKQNNIILSFQTQEQCAWIANSLNSSRSSQDPKFWSEQ